MRYKIEKKTVFVLIQLFLFQIKARNFERVEKVNKMIKCFAVDTLKFSTNLNKLKFIYKHEFYSYSSMCV